ncbi:MULTISPECIES: winged helix DNA-binding protein [Chromobacterium]|uniref:Transcriptional regulator n=3 Tax=Chromobacterium TaxID=535 RepID=A0A1D9LEL6_9NEIS|nr:winged helix DNA-binding protein [Chromobacterium vaccinii]MCD4505585.1 winged helix DNA-binding protein [Chromobacterium piscinae]AOZ49702.1 transcriptional regulator [Chromobacterium vaccinii]MBX9296913.1 winged helix DNA-binding protein [Chromobacterium vaccinii]MBX9349300.1 winged helix DNA-binding protein [Chromobacterium vaccinii]MBX9357472.1 winged helix DNA-binding protein [Chromobacterium vaccinii]
MSTTQDLPKIVSSQHLVSERSPELSEFEFSLTVVNNAFHRWMVRCMAAAGEKDMTPTEVLLVHHVNHRGRQKKLADICFVLNMEDTHVVSYALKKLVKMGYVESEKSGKEVLFSTTESGRELCERYRQVREQCLMATLGDGGIANPLIGDIAQLMRTLAGIYDQAARAGASF